MTIAQAREIVKEAPKYNPAPNSRPGSTWRARVDAMSDKQVWAVYFRMLRANELVTK